MAIDDELPAPYTRRDAANAYRKEQTRVAETLALERESRIAHRFTELLQLLLKDIASKAPHQESLCVRVDERCAISRIEEECLALDQVMRKLGEPPYEYAIKKMGIFWRDGVDGSYTLPEWTISWRE